MKKCINFENKNIIDFGCNTGGMIFHLPELNYACGIDFNKDCIDFCNFFSKSMNYTTHHYFYCKDLNKFKLNDLIKEHNFEIDYIFLFSLGSWIKEWKTLYIDCIHYCKNIILETNNDIEGKSQLNLFKELNCNIQLISENSNDDITNNYKRKTYLIAK
jgi:SAM-dependent methyltransferase